MYVCDDIHSKLWPMAIVIGETLITPAVKGEQATRRIHIEITQEGFSKGLQISVGPNQLSLKPSPGDLG